MASYDLGNLCQMFKGTVRSILVALQDGNHDRAVDVCTNSLRCLGRLEQVAVGSVTEKEGKRALD